MMPRKTHPKIAAIWGTFLFFGSTFADFTIQRKGVPEVTKVLMSLIFPNLAVARASKNLVTFEYKPGGEGLTYESLWVNYENFRIATYFAVMGFSLVAQTSIGILVENRAIQNIAHSDPNT